MCSVEFIAPSSLYVDSVCVYACVFVSISFAYSENSEKPPHARMVKRVVVPMVSFYFQRGIHKMFNFFAFSMI